MFEVLTTEEMREAELSAINEGIKSFSLMEAAGFSVASQIIESFKPCYIMVLCGSGNNGGDGFITAQKLKEEGWNITIASMVKRNKLKGDAALAAQKWDGEIKDLNSNLSVHNIEIVVDAIFGTGFKGELSPELITLFNKIKVRKIPVIAVDIPSGINATTGIVAEDTLKAQLTVTFCRKKIGHLLLPSKNLCGKIITSDILITDKQVASINSNSFENTPALWLKDFPIAKEDEHKYNRGHSLIFGGKIRTGAACLAAKASQKIGAGLTTIISQEDSLNIYKLYRASLMVDEFNNIDEFKNILRDEGKNAILIGSGSGIDIKEYIDAIFSFNKYIVLDADVFSAYKNKPSELLENLSENCVLTPHEGEFKRLFPNLTGNKLDRAREAAKISNAIIVLKGGDTIIAAPDRTAVINTNAPPSLATAGSGDVLAGMITGLMAQGMPPFMASSAAVWLHGESARNYGFGLTAEDIISNISKTLNNLFGINPKI